MFWDSWVIFTYFIILLLYLTRLIWMEGSWNYNLIFWDHRWDQFTHFTCIFNLVVGIGESEGYISTHLMANEEYVPSFFTAQIILCCENTLLVLFWLYWEAFRIYSLFSGFIQSYLLQHDRKRSQVGCDEEFPVIQSFLYLLWYKIEVGDNDFICSL